MLRMLNKLHRKKKRFNEKYCLSVRSLKLSTARILIAHGADQNMANSLGETPMTIAEHLQPDQQQSFVNVLVRKYLLIPKEIFSKIKKDISLLVK